MTNKHRGIHLKKHLSLEDPGQKTLLRVTHSRLVPPEHLREDEPSAHGTGPDASSSVQSRRRAIARLLRQELEHTLGILDRALDSILGTDRRRRNG